MVNRKNSDKRAGIRIALGLKEWYSVSDNGLLYPVFVALADHVCGSRLKCRIAKISTLPIREFQENTKRAQGKSMVKTVRFERIP